MNPATIWSKWETIAWEDGPPALDAASLVRNAATIGAALQGESAALIAQADALVAGFRKLCHADS